MGTDLVRVLPLHRDPSCRSPSCTRFPSTCAEPITQGALGYALQQNSTTSSTVWNGQRAVTVTARPSGAERSRLLAAEQAESDRSWTRDARTAAAGMDLVEDANRVAPRRCLNRSRSGSSRCRPSSGSSKRHHGRDGRRWRHPRRCRADGNLTGVGSSDRQGPRLGAARQRARSDS